MKIWFKQPAKHVDSIPYGSGRSIEMWGGWKNGWNEALPIGNGRLGAMVFGGVTRERIQLNEETLWGGSKVHSENPLATQALREIQRLLFEGKNDEATSLAEASFMGVPATIQSFQSLGDLFIEALGHPGTFTNYSRELNLSDAVVTVKYDQGGASFRHEMFATHPGQAIVINISCNRKGSLSRIFSFSRERSSITTYQESGGRGLIVNSGSTDSSNVDAMSFETRVLIIPDGGSLTHGEGGISVSNADQITIIVVASTTYAGRDPVAFNKGLLSQIELSSAGELKKLHVQDHRRLFDRVSINLKGMFNQFKPTDILLKECRDGSCDTYLSELVYQFGRYLLIASSRPGDLPANLQGIWCQHLNAPWNSDYHLNINLQMNYWGAEVANLSECHLPLFTLIDSLSVHGARTAREMYDARGWVAHHLTDIFWRTTPADGPHGIWPMGGAWLCRHLWDHYQFTNDIEFLAQRAYPLMKGSAEFMLDFLVEIPKGNKFAGMLVTNPSHSPENAFEKANGEQSQFTYGATMDLQIISDLFTQCIEAGTILSKNGVQIDTAFTNSLKQSLRKLVPMQVSRKTGKLQEWIDDYKETELGHRHFSHLYGVFPGQQITLIRTPEVSRAARASIEARLRGNPNAEVEERNNRWLSYDSYLNDEGGGNWQKAWLVALWGRLLDGERAYKTHLQHLKSVLSPNLMGDILAQLDGSYGMTGSLSELFLQSHNDEIYILPALPRAWPEGWIRGLKARGGFVLNIEWSDNALTGAEIFSLLDGKCTVRSRSPFRLRGARGRCVRDQYGYVFTFDAKERKTYHLVSLN